MNLVNELQVSAEKDDVLTVLRKTRRLASKLGRSDIAEWLQWEQGGYPNGKSLPDYRMIATAFAFNTNGYVPAGFGHLMRGIQELPPSPLAVPYPLLDSISVVLSMIESHRAGNGLYHNVDGTDYGKLMRQHIKFDPMFERQVSLLLHLNETQIEAIPERIKDKVLDWACNLENAGVFGEGMSFSDKEKEIAHATTFNLSYCQIDQLNNQGTNQRGN